MNDYEIKLERGLLLYLREEHGVNATSASIGESEVEKGWGGCETCGYGGSEDTITTPIYYQRSGDVYSSGTIEIDGTSIGFLPTLLEYIDRAN